MNIYELEKEATPGIHDRGSGWAEAKLARHCRSNFMRALEALKEEHEAVMAWLGKKHAAATCAACKLIAELEEVK